MDQGFSNSSDSDLSDLDVEYDSEGEDDPDNLNSDNNSDTSPRVSNDDDDVDLCVPDLKQNPIKWTEHFQTFNVSQFTGQSGPALPPDWNPKSMPRDCFQLFWTDDLLNNIVKYTNQYARLAIMKKCTHQPEYVDNEWSLNGCNNISYEELCAYMGSNIILSVNLYRQLKHVFSSDPFMSNSGIRNVFTLKRFTKISNYFCVSDKLCEPPKDSPQYDKLYKVRPVLEQMNRLFPRYYKGSSHQAIDESMIKTKSRDSMCNYCSMKPCKFGFKIWSRCDSKFAERPYLIQFEPYLGKRFTKASKHGLFFDIVSRLTDSLRDTNVRVYTDSAYSSCKTALFLLQKGIRMTSTVHWNSVGLHPFVKELPKKMTRGAHKTFQDRNNPALTCTVWKDTKAVRFISTETNPTVMSFALRRVASSYMRINQPLVASKYANNYKSVDFFDFATTKYQLGHRSYRLWIYVCNWGHTSIHSKCLHIVYGYQY